MLKARLTWLQVSQKFKNCYTYPKSPKGIGGNIEGIVVDIFEDRVESAMFIVQQNFDELFIHRQAFAEHVST